MSDGASDAAREDTSEAARLRTLAMDGLRPYGGGSPASDRTSETRLDEDLWSAYIALPEFGSTSMRLLLRVLCPLLGTDAFEYRALA